VVNRRGVSECGVGGEANENVSSVGHRAKKMAAMFGKDGSGGINGD